MSLRADLGSAAQSRGGTRAAVLSVLAIALVAAMALDTKVVRQGSAEDVRADVFSPKDFGAKEFPAIQASVESRAAEAGPLAAAIAADKVAAGKKYGVAAGVAPVIPVKFTGVAGERKSGSHMVAVEGLPAGITVRVQTGPAINGTDLRDATGTITFGQFKNQIEFQNAGAALNDAMKQQVLAGVDAGALTGRTVSVVGVFKLINPKNWLVTPVRLTAQ